jgi:hypothetical protein
MRLFVELSREMRAGVFARNRRPDWGGYTSVLVTCAVGIGHADGRAMNATKISHFLDVPRTTVLRNLRRLIELKIVIKRGLLYLLDPSIARQFTREPIYRKVLTRGFTELRGFL